MPNCIVLFIFSLKYGLEPVLFTPTLLNQKARNKSTSWRCLGYIPAFDQKSSAGKASEGNTINSHGRSTRNYHKCLEAVLKSFFEAMGEPFITFVRCGNMVKKVELVLVFAYVIGDAKSQDNLCGRYNNYVNTTRICRACDCPKQELDNPYYECTFICAKSSASGSQAEGARL